MGRGLRPEFAAPPEVFYNADEAQKYTANTRMAEIQVGAHHAHMAACSWSTHLAEDVCAQGALTERAIELLALPEDGMPRMLLDLGCGSGLSGELLSERGHSWVVRCCRNLAVLT